LLLLLLLLKRNSKRGDAMRCDVEEELGEGGVV